MNTQVSTYFTVPDGESKLLYSAEDYCRISFMLETSGPVAVGTREDVTPVTSGKGALLPVDGRPLRFNLQKGERVYIASEAFNRVALIIEPLPTPQAVVGKSDETIRALSAKLDAVSALGVQTAAPTISESEEQVSYPVCPESFRY